MVPGGRPPPATLMGGTVGCGAATSAHANARVNTTATCQILLCIRPRSRCAGSIRTVYTPVNPGDHVRCVRCVRCVYNRLRAGVGNANGNGRAGPTGRESVAGLGLSGGDSREGGPTLGVFAPVRCRLYGATRFVLKRPIPTHSPCSGGWCRLWGRASVGMGRKRK